VRSGTEAAVDKVAVTKEEYPVYLKKAYGAEKFDKPRNALGMVKEQPVTEMERLILAHIKVTHDDLRILARQRSQAVREHLVRSGKVEAERVFLVEPKSLRPPERKDKVRESRVDFKLR